MRASDQTYEPPILPGRAALGHYGKYGCNFVGVCETDVRHGGGNDLFTREKDGALADLKFLFEKVEFESFQRREHLVDVRWLPGSRSCGAATKMQP